MNERATYDPFALINAAMRHLAAEGFDPPWSEGYRSVEAASALLRSMGIEPVQTDEHAMAWRMMPREYKERVTTTREVDHRRSLR